MSHYNAQGHARMAGRLPTSTTWDVRLNRACTGFCVCRLDEEGQVEHLEDANGNPRKFKSREAARLATPKD